MAREYHYVFRRKIDLKPLNLNEPEINKKFILDQINILCTLAFFSEFTK